MTEQEERKVKAHCGMCGQPVYAGQSHHICALFSDEAIEYRAKKRAEENEVKQR